MFGSDAGLVRIEKVILTTTATSADSGPTCLEARDWRNWTLTVEGTMPGGCQVTWYGTNDINTAGTLPGTATPAYTPSLAVVPTQTNWFILPAGADQTGTGVEANPQTLTTQSMSYDRPLRSVRGVVTGNTLGNSIRLKVAAVP